MFQEEEKSKAEVLVDESDSKQGFDPSTSRTQAATVGYANPSLTSFTCKAEFSGDDRTSVETYLFVFKLALNRYQLTLWQDQILVIAETLNGEPLQWFQRNAQAFGSWSDFENAIIAQYSQASNEEELALEFFKLKQATSTKDYVSQWNKFEQMASKHMSEKFLRYKFKAGLKDYFLKVIGRFEIDGKKLSLSDMKRIVVDEERLSTRDVAKNHTKDQKDKPRRTTASTSTSSKSDVECYYCGKKGHTKRECRRVAVDREMRIFLSSLPEVAARRTVAVNEVSVAQKASKEESTEVEGISAVNIVNDTQKAADPALIIEKRINDLTKQKVVLKEKRRKHQGTRKFEMTEGSRRWRKRQEYLKKQQEKAQEETISAL